MVTPTPPTTSAERKHWDKNWDILMNTVLDEDFVIARRMQRNYGSGARRHAVFGRQEGALQHFHRVLDSELEGGGTIIAHR